MVQSLKTAEINKLAAWWTSQEVVHDAITCRHPPIPAPSRVESKQDKQHLQQQF
jgi:hypothetical protein